MWVKAQELQTYKVTLPRDGNNYYAEAPDADTAVNGVLSRDTVMSDHRLPEDETTKLYMNRMAGLAKVELWEAGLPELSSQAASGFLSNVMQTYLQGRDGYWFDINWDVVNREIALYGLSTPDMAAINQHLKSLPNAPEQLALPGVEAFTKDSNQAHPAAKIAGDWKTSHKMKFVTIDKLSDIIDDDTVTVSIKMDGELVAIVFNGTSTETVTSRGTIRYKMPATEEATKLLSGHKSATFMGELYATDEAGKPQSYMKAASIIRDPHSQKDNLIKLAVFDVLELDGEEVGDKSIDDKIEIINGIFSKGQAVHPVITMQQDMGGITKLWDQLTEKGWEGIIAYVGTMIYKVKPIMSYDMVVVAIEKSPRLIDRIGAVLCSFIDKEGFFRLNGSVGGGFTDEEKVELYGWAERNKVREDEERIWVDPFKEPLIVEVEAMEVNVKDRPKMQFTDGKWVEIEEDISGVLRFPHVTRVRDDKEPTYKDVPLEQLPLEQQSHAAVEKGTLVRTVTGCMGKVLALVPCSGGSKTDFGIVIEWDPPLFGEIAISEIHSTEVVEVM